MHQQLICISDSFKYWGVNRDGCSFPPALCVAKHPWTKVLIFRPPCWIPITLFLSHSRIMGFCTDLWWSYNRTDLDSHLLGRRKTEQTQGSLRLNEETGKSLFKKLFPLQTKKLSSPPVRALVLKAAWGMWGSGRPNLMVSGINCMCPPWIPAQSETQGNPHSTGATVSKCILLSMTLSVFAYSEVTRESCSSGLRPWETAIPARLHGYREASK